MITLTDKAIKQVKQLISQDADSAKIIGLRVSIRAGGCAGYSYKMDFAQEEPSSQDKTFDQDGLTVIIDSRSLLFMTGMELDFDGGLNGQGFVFNNPNASRGCGCGSSFSV